jgi:hypothetical protein
MQIESRRPDSRPMARFFHNISYPNDVRCSGDIVAKVENRTTSKISQKLIFGRRGYCNTP